MSHLGRFTHWLCDVCGAQEHREGFGLPNGWGWFATSLGSNGQSRIAHACADCRQKRSDAEILEGLKTAATVAKAMEKLC